MITLSVILAMLFVAGSGYTAWQLTDDGDTKTTTAAGGDQPGGADAKPKSVAGRELFSVAYPKISASVMGTDGLWATEKTVAKGEPYAVAGYDSASGKEQWRLPLDGEICGASQHMTEDGKAAVLFQDHKPANKDDHPSCSVVAVIDIAQGKKLWQGSGTDGDQPLRLDEVTVGGGAVAAGGTSGAIVWKLEGGDPLWQSQSGTECSEDGFGGGRALVAVVRCGNYSSPQMRVEKLDVNTKQPVWSYRLPNGTQYAQLLSTDPVVVGLTLGDHSGTSDLLSLDDQGRLRARISLGTVAGGGDSAKYDPNCEATEIEPCRTVAVDGSYVYLASQEHSSGSADGRSTNEIVAFDLGTGKEVRKFDAGEGRTVAPLRMAGSKLLVYLEPTYKEPGRVLAIDPATGKQDAWLRLPASQSEIDAQLSPDRDTFAYAHGRIYMGLNTVSDDGGEHNKYLMVAYGSA
ncbi:PQQ-binding-like beta-propeller repeat protein [Streptomyces sp. NPDC051940]|uniref:outer membrane protein assembly factor BamB family protein n=1 Tax=Streptomyces sp. NPDC051940 TaxID=3155675 RepID=UPI0034235D60